LAKWDLGVAMPPHAEGKTAPCSGRTAHSAPEMTPAVDQHTGPTAGRLQADRPANAFACSRHDDHTPCQWSGGGWDVASFMKSPLAKTGRIRVRHKACT